MKEQFLGYTFPEFKGVPGAPTIYPTETAKLISTNMIGTNHEMGRWSGYWNGAPKFLDTPRAKFIYAYLALEALLKPRWQTAPELSFGDDMEDFEFPQFGTFCPNFICAIKQTYHRDMLEEVAVQEEGLKRDVSHLWIWPGAKVQTGLGNIDIFSDFEKKYNIIAGHFSHSYGCTITALFETYTHYHIAIDYYGKKLEAELEK